MQIDLTGITALVTGGSGGIGEEISRGLASSGARIALHYNSNRDGAERLIKEFDNGSIAFHSDLSLKGNAAGLFDDVVERMKRVDLLVNNAGIIENAPVSLPGMEWMKIWERTMEINLNSTGMLCHAAIKHFLKNSGGRIVNIASRAAFRGEKEDFLAYAASKGGMVSLSRSIARSFGRSNIKSFVIAPGYVWTPMTERVEDKQAIIDNELSLGEMTEPKDVAPLVTFIAAGLLDHGTGATIDINAGSYMR
ncbi:MAG: SDR family oxidoreductase [Candidatus Krumholzibacteriota bacterium]|nr:SDR family oxidoreductase [Candidatus Krumholzibacteriota bacterium]